MRISGINSYNMYAYKDRNNQPTQSAKNIPANFGVDFSAKSPAFTGVDVINTGVTVINKILPPLRKFKYFTISEYSGLSKSELEFLRREYDQNIPEHKKQFVHNLEVIHDRVSEMLMNTYDKKYGKGNYVVIPIGRSVSSICKVLGYKIGENNVRPLPMSSTRYYNSDREVEKVKDTKEFAIFKDYLTSLGLSDGNLIFSKKKYILLDYCVSGKSLSGIKNLFKSVIEHQEKLVYDDVMTHINDPETYTLTKDYLLNEDFKYLSFVKKARNFKDPYTSFTDTDKVTRATRLTWFKLLDNEMTGRNYGQNNLILD